MLPLIKRLKALKKPSDSLKICSAQGHLELAQVYFLRL